jgi:hypothetical protein
MEKIETKIESNTINYRGGIYMARSNENTVRDFLNILYGKSQGEGHLVLWTKQDKRSYFFTKLRKRRFLCLKTWMSITE